LNLFITVMLVQKIKRTDVRKKGGRRSFFKVVLIALFFILLFVVGFFAAAYITKIIYPLCKLVTRKRGLNFFALFTSATAVAVVFASFGWEKVVGRELNFAENITGLVG